jgi:hypothetical protein
VQVVDQRATVVLVEELGEDVPAVKLARVEEVGIVREEIPEVVEPDGVDEVVEEVALVEGQPYRVVGRIDQEERENDQRREDEQDSLKAAGCGAETDPSPFTRRWSGDRSWQGMRAYSNIVAAPASGRRRVCRP